MRRYLTILLILMLIAIGGRAQLSINLTGEWPEKVQARIILFNGLSVYQLDGGMISSEEFFAEIPDSIRSAMFTLQLSDSLNVIYESRIVYDGNIIDLELKLYDQNLDIEWGSDSLNVKYHNFISHRDAMVNRLRILRGLYSYYPDTASGFYNKLEQTYRQQNTEMDSLFQVYNLEQKDGALYAYIMATWMYVPSSSDNMQAQLDGLMNHFYDHYNPLNPAIIASPVYHEKLDEYLNLIVRRSALEGGQEEQYIINTIDDYLTHIMDSLSLYESSLKYIWDFMHKKSMESVTEYLDVNYLAGSCMAENDERLKERLLAYERLAVGSMAPDIRWKDNSEQRSLTDFRGKYTLLVFWASWCPHCTRSLAGIHEYFLSEDNLNILAIGLDENEIAWNNAIMRYPKWTHIRAVQKWDSPVAMDYAIYATPTFYIIDGDGKIIGKAKSLQEIKQYIP